MEKLVPFKKEIDFDTNIDEITSISLEHTLSLKEPNLIAGNFTVSGEYKMNNTSINTDHFKYDLPFEISIDKKYETKDVKVDINDFNYEVINNKSLMVDIEVVIEGLEEIEVKEEPIMEEDAKVEEDIVEEKLERDENVTNPISAIFNDLDNSETYVTYKVHVIGENETIESIAAKYETTSTKLALYNNLSDIKIGDKIIIPTND